MSKQIGFRSTGDDYLYIETVSAESFAMGFDAITSTFNVNVLPGAGAIPDETTSNIAIDPTANGDLVLQSNGTGEITLLNNVNISNGNLLIANTASTDGQIILGNSSGNAAWASLTSTDGSITFTPGANSLDLSVTGPGAGLTFPTDSGTATPNASDEVYILGGSNMNTEGSGDSVTINLNEFIDWPENTSSTTGVININSNRFLHSFGTNNLFLGSNAGNFTTSGTGQNVVIGANAASTITTADRSVIIGYNAGSDITSAINNTIIGNAAFTGVGNANVIIGSGALGGATGVNASNVIIGQGAGGNIDDSCDRNIIIGLSSGSNLINAASSNILIGNAGVDGEDNTIRIGTQGTGDGEQDTCFIAGIQGVTPAGGNDDLVTIDTNGQLGSITSATSLATTFDTDSGSATPAANTIDIAGGSNINTSGASDTVTVNLDNTISITSISFDSGTNNLSTFVGKTSFNPQLRFGGNSSGLTYSTQEGFYTRVGDMVHYTIILTLSAKGLSTGNADILFDGGVPGVIGNVSATFYVDNVTNAADSTIMGKLQGDESMRLYEHNNSAANTRLTHANFADDSEIIVQGSYWAA